MVTSRTRPREPARSGDEQDWISPKARRILGRTSGRAVKRAINRRECRTGRLAAREE